MSDGGGADHPLERKVGLNICGYTRLGMTDAFSFSAVIVVVLVPSCFFSKRNRAGLFLNNRLTCVDE